MPSGGGRRRKAPRRGGNPSRCAERQKEEEQEERTEKNGKEHGRRRSAPPLEIIACSRGISECGRKAASGERQGPEPGCEKRGKSEARRTGGSREAGREGVGM